jgi:predicted ester cyclase
MIGEGDRVMIRYIVVATDTEGFMGKPATGIETRTPAMQLFRLDNGQIVESWAVRDDLRTLRRLGHIPSPGTNH